MTFSAEREWNWAGTYEFRAGSIRRPKQLEELQETVARAPHVRGLGTRHSFSGLADGAGILVSLTDMPADIVIAPDRRSVSVGAGTRYAALATALEAEGLALHNMGSLPHISIGGATATGTHGSGVRNGSLSTSVAGLQFVTADGDLRVVRRGDDEFDGSVIHLGALGVVSRVTLDVEPSFRVRQDVYRGLPWSALDDGGLEALLARAYSVSLFTDYGDEITQLWVKTRIPDGEADVEVPDVIEGARRDDRQGRLDGVSDAGDNTTPMDGSVGPWHQRLPHFRIDRTPSNGVEIQTEYFVPLEEGARAVAAVRELASRIRPHLLVTELRAVAADELWLSETQGHDCLCLHFTWARHPAEVAELLPVIEEALRPFAARPHWGKAWATARAELDGLYPRLEGFRALVRRHDPNGKFSGEYLEERILGPSASASGVA